MMAQRLSAVLLIACTSVILFTLYAIWAYHSNVKTDTSLVTQFEQHCQIVETPPFVDVSLRLRFNFASNLFVCDYRPAAVLKGREIFLLAMDAFHQTTSIGFTGSIAAEVLVNLPDNFQSLPGDTSVTTTTMLIAGTSTTIEMLQSQCANEPCPSTKIGRVERDGNKFVIEEFRPNTDLFDSLEFLSTKPL